MKFFKIVLLSLVLLVLSFSFSHYPTQGPPHGCAPASTGAGMCVPPDDGANPRPHRPTIQPSIQ